MNTLAKNRLNDIADVVNAEHNELETILRDSMAKAVKIGGLLTEAKELAGHGAWGKWLSEHCQFSERSAQNYMRVFVNFPELSKSATVADLTYKQALGLLTEPKISADDVCELLVNAMNAMKAAAESMTVLDFAVMDELCQKAEVKTRDLLGTFDKRLKSDDLTLSECVTYSKDADKIARQANAYWLTAARCTGKFLNMLQAVRE